MSIQLSPLCQSFVESMNAYQSGPFLDCFAQNARVEDESKTYQGHEEIKSWIEKAFTDYQPLLQVENVISNSKETVIIGPVSGSFDGSPITICYHLAIADGKITELRCAAD